VTRAGMPAKKMVKSPKLLPGIVRVARNIDMALRRMLEVKILRAISSCIKLLYVLLDDVDETVGHNVPHPSH
jgi:hypothetical protein